MTFEQYQSAMSLSERLWPNEGPGYHAKRVTAVLHHLRSEGWTDAAAEAALIGLLKSLAGAP